MYAGNGGLSVGRSGGGVRWRDVIRSASSSAVAAASSTGGAMGRNIPPSDTASPVTPSGSNGGVVGTYPVCAGVACREWAPSPLAMASAAASVVASSKFVIAVVDSCVGNGDSFDRSTLPGLDDSGAVKTHTRYMPAHGTRRLGHVREGRVFACPTHQQPPIPQETCCLRGPSPSAHAAVADGRGCNHNGGAQVRARASDRSVLVRTTHIVENLRKKSWKLYVATGSKPARAASCVSSLYGTRYSSQSVTES